MRTKNSLFIKHFFVICLICFFSLLTQTFAQDAEQLIDFEFKNISLREALNYLINTYNIPLAFQDKDVEGKMVTINCNSCTIDRALNLILKDTLLSWEKSGRQYVIFNAQANKNNVIFKNKFAVSNINGCVVDSINNEALPYANILLKDTGKGTISNMEGRFALLNAPARLCTVQVRYIGYRTNDVKTDASDSTDYLKIKMQQQAIETKGVIVTGDRVPVWEIFKNPGQIRFSPQDVDFIPAASRGDIMQSMQTLPSISFFSNELDGLYVRGGTPDQNLILFDGIPIYHTEHLMGFMSVFNRYAIENVQLYKGLFSAKYGDRLSSVIELQGKSADTTKFKAGFSANFMNAQGFVQVPISEKLQGYFTYRKSYFNSNLHKLQIAPNYDKFSYISIKNFISNTSDRAWIANSDLDFYDITGKLLFNPTKKDNWTFTIFSGKDEATAKNTLNTTQELKNSGISAKWSRKWSNTIRSEFITSYSKYTNEFDKLHSSDYYYGGEFSPLNATNKIADFNFRFFCKMLFNPLLNICWGTDFSRKVIENTTYLKNEFGFRDLHGNTAWTRSIFLQDNIRIFPFATLTLGLRGSNYRKIKTNYIRLLKPINEINIDPRISFELDLDHHIKFKAAWGHSHQNIHRILGKDLYECTGAIWCLPNAKLKPAFAKHQSIGLFYHSEQINVELSGYKKHYNNLIHFSPDDSGNPGTYLYDYFETGNGKSLGLEIFAQKKQGFFRGWISYHLGKTEYLFATVNNGNAFLADHDRRHELKTVIYFPLGKWNCSLSGYYASGKPYTPIENIHSLTLINGEKRWFFHQGNKNSKRLSDYKRLDVSISKPFKNKFSITGEIGFSILNIFGIDNSWRRTYTMLESEDIVGS